MTTLICYRKSNGKIIGRCDARCYNAKGTKCTCICGGKNHGIGLKAALERTRNYYPGWPLSKEGLTVEIKGDD